MRSPAQLLTSRTRLRPRYALFPLEGIPLSRLPEWPGAAVRVLAAPALGAGFAQYLIDLEPGQAGEHRADGQVEYFFYLLKGSLELSAGGRRASLRAGGYALLSPDVGFGAEAAEATSLLLLRKRYEAAAGIPLYAPLFGSQDEAEPRPYGGDPGARLQVLIPDEPGYDLAMNIFTFDPGRGLPVTETHVMEHGLFLLEGKGLYYLGEDWMEVEAEDFIWMGPYCPQAFYATGPGPSRYIYYKNVNREIPL